MRLEGGVLPVQAQALTIGQVAKATGVGIETIRFYERKGLIAEPPRRVSGYREYAPDVIARLRFIKRAKDLGFSLDEIAEMLSLRVAPDATCSEVRRLAQEKLARIEAKIADLQRIRGALLTLTAACPGRGPTGACPILEAIEGGADAQ